MISVITPAYNNPIYLEKCLRSILKQSYRPIEIIVSDDCSPVSLKKTVKKIEKLADKQIFIKYFRQKKNLGIYWNLIFAYSKATGEYGVFMQHDDYYKNKLFFEKSIRLFVENKNVHTIIANSEDEFSKRKSYDFNFKSWQKINGSKYISEYLFNNAHPTFTGVLYRLETLKKQKYNNYYVSFEEAEKMKVEIDECFVALILTASLGDIYITSETVSISGKPQTAATKLNLHLQKGKHRDVGMFIPYYLLYKYFKINKNFLCMSEMKRLLTSVFCVGKINFEILSYLNWNLDAITLMVISYTNRILRKIKSTTYLRE